jgi:hypothetical protein
MKDYLKIIRLFSLRYVIVFFLTALPTLIFAQGTLNPNPGSGGPSQASSSGSQGLSFSIKNPLKFDSIPELFNAILNIFIVILTPLVVIFIILAGFKYVMAQGNPAKIQEATQALTYAIIGGILIVGAFAITAIISNFVNAFAA